MVPDCDAWVTTPVGEKKEIKRYACPKKKMENKKMRYISVIWVVMKVLSLPSELNHKIQEPYEKLYP